MKQAGFFDLPEPLHRLPAAGDPPEDLGRIIDFEAFGRVLSDALNYAGGSRGGRPPYDAVAMFKVLILAARHNVSDERMEFLIRDRLSRLRFLGFDPGQPRPDENTIRAFREPLTEGGAMKALFDEFDRRLKGSGYLAMGGRIVDATLAGAPRQRHTDAGKAAIKDGQPAGGICSAKPHKAPQKDVDARWTVKFSKAKPKAELTAGSASSARSR